MDANKIRVLINAFIKSQFSFFIWIFHNRTFNSKINRLHEEALILGYRNKISRSFEDLPKKDKTVNIHYRKLQILATEIYKVKMI